MIFFWVLLATVAQYADAVITVKLLATGLVIELNPLVMFGGMPIEGMCAIKVVWCILVLALAILARSRGHAKGTEAWIAFMAGMSMMPAIYHLLIWSLL